MQRHLRCEMSNQTVHLSSEQNLATKGGPLPSPSDLRLVLSPGDRNGNSAPCPRDRPSPEESQSSLSSLSNGSTSSPPDWDMLDACLGWGSPRSSTSATARVNNAAPADDWNANVALAIRGLEGGPPGGLGGSGGGRRGGVLGNRGAASATPSDSPAEDESSSGSGGASRRASSDNDCSVSSREMMMRRNSFCLQEEQPLSISLLEESAGSPALGPRSPALAAELGLPPASLPDARKEGLTSEGVARDTDAAAQARWGTFILPDDLDLPSEDDRSPDGTPHQRNLRCDPAAAASEQLGAEGRTFVLSACEELDSAGPAQTSTPVGNQTICFPALAESPQSPAPPWPAKDQRAAVTNPRQRHVARLLQPAGGTGKGEIKRFSKPDFSNVRPKIATRPACPAGTSAPGKAAQVNSPRQTCANRSTPVRKRHPGVASSMPLLSSADEDGRSNRPPGVAGEDAFGVTFLQWDELNSSLAAVRRAGGTLSVTEEEGQGGASVFDSVPAAPERAPIAAGGQAALEPDQGANGAAAATGPSSQTACLPTPSKSPFSSDQGEPVSAPANESPGKEEALNQNGKRPGSASNQDKPPAPARRSRFWSEAGSSPRPIRETRASLSSSSSGFAQARAGVQPGQTTPGAQSRLAQNRQAKQPETRMGTPDRSSRAVRKISLTTSPAAGASAAGGASREGGAKSRLAARPLPSRARAAPAPQAPAAGPGPRAPPPAPRQRPGTLGRDGCRIPGGMGLPRTKPTTTTNSAATTGRQRTRSTDGPSTAAPSTNGSAKSPAILGSATGHPSAPASRLPRQPQAPPRSALPKAGVHSEPSGGGAGGPHVSGGPAQSSVGRPGSSRTTATRTGHLVLPVRSTEAALSTGHRTTASAPSQASSRSGAAHLKWGPPSRLARPTAALPVDKSRPKAGPPRGQPQHQPAPQPPPQSHGPPDQAPPELLQQALAERDEAVKQHRELAEEMVTLRGELVSSAHCCERLEGEREEARAATEEALRTAQERHGSELAGLQERLQAFYQAEWDAAQRTAQERHGSELAGLQERLQAFYQAEWDAAQRACQEEADRVRAHMDQQMGELRANHEALRLELETRHAQQLQDVKEQYEGSLGELRSAHEQDLQALGRVLKEAEATLSAQIQELSQRLKAEEDRRRELAEKNQKDSHTLYLEQELESLKVVLDIKNKQLHQQDKKLMQMDKLMEKSVKLDECLQRVQQENEDLRARMDRHCALSRQLSTEQAVLQETLQKESKVNKRLSMENEELLWKLHNGDLASPRKSPVSPSHSLGLQSPRSPPVSPR